MVVCGTVFFFYFLVLQSREGNFLRWSKSFPRKVRLCEVKVMEGEADWGICDGGDMERIIENM